MSPLPVVAPGAARGFFGFAEGFAHQGMADAAGRDAVVAVSAGAADAAGSTEATGCVGAGATTGAGGATAATTTDVDAAGAVAARVLP